MPPAYSSAASERLDARLQVADASVPASMPDTLCPPAPAQEPGREQEELSAVRTSRPIGEGAEWVVRKAEGRHSPSFGLVRKNIRQEAAWLLQGDRMNKRQEQYRRLREHFRRVLGEEGKDVIVHQKLWRSRDGEPQLFQVYVPEIDVPHYQLSSGIGETHLPTRTPLPGPDGVPLPAVPDIEQYQRVNEVLIQGRSPERFSLRDFLQVQGSDSLCTLLRAAEETPALRDYLCRLVQAMILHTCRTGDIFDTDGADNMILFERGDSGQYTARFIDPLYPVPHALHIAQEALALLAHDVPIRTYQLDVLTAVLNYARTVNGLAMALGVEERVDVVPESLKELPISINFRSFPAAVTRQLQEEQQHPQAA